MGLQGGVVMRCFGSEYHFVDSRIDPDFFRPAYVQLDHLLERVGYKRLGEIARFSSRTRNPEERPEEEFEYVDITAINANLGVIENTQRLLGKEAPSRARKVIREGNIIVSTVRPYRNAIARVPANLDNQICSTGFAVITNALSNCTMDYLFVVLRLKSIVKQLVRYSMGSAYPAITETDLKKVKIPVPPLEQQREIVAMMREAYLERDARLREADRLVGEIDSFVMRSLGIRFEEPTPERTFRSEYRMLSDRMEAEYYGPQFSLLEQALEESDYPLLPLGRVVHSIRNGIDCRDYVEVGTPYIRVADVSDNGQINARGARQIAMSLDELDKTLRLNEGDIFFTRKGTPGNVAVVKGEAQNTIISSEIILLRLQSTVDPEYFEVFMNSLPGHRQVLRNTRGALNVGINHPTLLRLRIPVPDDKRVQRTIAEGVYDRRQRARELKMQARQLIGKAKAKVEAMILGQE